VQGKFASAEPPSTVDWPSTPIATPLSLRETMAPATKWSGGSRGDHGPRSEAEREGERHA
jgi:hypothetical protein